MNKPNIDKFGDEIVLIEEDDKGWFNPSPGRWENGPFGGIGTGGLTAGTLTLTNKRLNFDPRSGGTNYTRFIKVRKILKSSLIKIRTRTSIKIEYKESREMMEHASKVIGYNEAKVKEFIEKGMEKLHVVHFLVKEPEKWLTGLRNFGPEALEKQKEKNFKESGFKETDYEKRKRNEIETERRKIEKLAEETISQGSLENYQTAKNIYIDNEYLLGKENTDKLISELRMKIAKELERLLRYEEAIEVWEDLENHNEAKRIRQKMIDEKKVKVTQKVVHGDEVTKTEIKDSVLNRSNVGSGGDDKFTKLKELKEMLAEGLIDDDEFKQMKKEILEK